MPSMQIRKRCKLSLVNRGTRSCSSDWFQIHHLPLEARIKLQAYVLLYVTSQVGMAEVLWHLPINSPSGGVRFPVPVFLFFDHSGAR